MEKHFYLSPVSNDSEHEEVTESVWLDIIGDKDHREYANKVYRGELSIEEVPEDKRETVQKIVNNKIARWGAFDKREISDSEALDIITGGNA